MAKVNGQRAKKLNVIDVIIIILLISLVGTFVYGIYTKVSSDTSSGNSKYRIVFECSEQYSSILNYLSDGEAVYFASGGELLGHLYDSNPNDRTGAAYEISDAHTDKEAALGNAYDSDKGNEAGTSYHKIRFGGELNLNTETVKSKRSDCYSIGDINITVGSTIKVYTDDAEFTLTIVSIVTTAQ